MGAIFNVFPLTALPLIFYNLLAFSAGSSAAARQLFERSAFSFPLSSTERVESVVTGVSVVFTLGDVFIIASMGLLFIELLKSTSTGTSAIVNHGLSILVLIVALLEFFAHPSFATAAFLVITITLLLDVLAGIIVTVISARRDVEFAGNVDR